MNGARTALVVVLVLAAASLPNPSNVRGDAPASSLVPEDTCILELELPAGATTSVDGRDYGDKRRLEFKPLKRGQIYASKLTVRFRDGSQAWRQLLLKGGWRVPLALATPGGERPELMIQTGHSAQIQSLQFSPDGQYLLSGAGDNCAILWRAADGRQLRRFSAQTMLHDIAFYPRGQEILLIGSRPSESQWPSAVLWDESTGQRTRALGESRGSRGAFSSDGAQFLFTSQKGAVAICDAGTGRRLRSYPACQASLLSPLAFSPDRQQFLIGHLDGKISLWDVDTGQRLRVLEGGHPRPKTDSTSGLAGIARQFEEAANESVGMPPGSVWIRSVAFSADGRRILTTGGESAVLWDAETGQLLHTILDHAGGNASAVFSPDSTSVLVASSDEAGNAALWDVESGRLVRSFAGAEGAVVAFSPNGQYVACVSERSASFGVWDADTGQHVRWFEGERITPLHVCTAEGGRQLAAVWGDTAAVWDLPSGRLMRSFKTGVNVSEQIAITPDGRRLFCYNWTGLQLWEVSSGVLLRDLQKSIPQGFTVHAVAMTDDGSRAVLAGSNREDRNIQLSLWNLENGAKVKDLPGGYGKLEHSGLSPDGRLAAVSSSDFSRFIFLDVARGQPLWSIRPIVFMSFSPDGQKVLMSAWTPQTTVVTGIWDAARGKLLRAMAFEDPDDNAWCGAFSPDSAQVLIGYASGAVRLFDASTGRLLRTFQGHTSFVNALAFGAGGRYVVSGSSDSTLRCWSVATGDELLRLTMVDDGRDWLAATPEGLFDGSEGGRERVAFRIGGGLNVVPVDRFFQDFYRPGLMASLWKAVP
ncbi:MAG TPA: WD40 repeat domain-containing protein, partial [Pirellulales bacterium]|nr:WD40 repeat domain-containing protein [Pirellulales bacterium]